MNKKMNYKTYEFSDIALTIIGAILCLIGIFLSLYVSVWIFIVGGIMGIASGISCDPMSVIAILIGVAKCLTAGVVGSIIFWFFFIFGIDMMNNKF